MIENNKIEQDCWHTTSVNVCCSVVSRSFLKGTEPFLRPKVPFIVTQNTPAPLFKRSMYINVVLLLSSV